MNEALRAHADTLHLVGNAADLLAASGAPTQAVGVLSLAAFNCVSAAISLARKAGRLEGVR